MAPPKKLAFNPGDRYGRLTVLRETRLANTPGRARHGFTQGPLGAACRCDCGNEITAAASPLASGNTRSCGCLRAEIASARLPSMAEANVTHGQSRATAKHPLYETWHGMMMRCYDKRHRWYGRYGGRGIKVFPAWHGAGQFIRDIETAIGPRPTGMSLDRIDNDGDYEPGNVRWATRLQQVRNRQPRKPPFTPEQVAAMRARRAARTPLRVLAEEQGCSISQIWKWTKD